MYALRVPLDDNPISNGLYCKHFCPLLLERRFFVIIILIFEIAHAMRQRCDENDVGTVCMLLPT